MHKWSVEENLICCKEYLKYSLKDDKLKPVTPLLNKLVGLLPDIKSYSILCKIQNIKQLCLEYDIPDFVDIMPLSNYSEVNKAAFYRLILESEIQDLIECRKEDLRKRKEEDKKNQKTIEEIKKFASSFRNKKFWGVLWIKI